MTTTGKLFTLGSIFNKSRGPPKSKGAEPIKKLDEPATIKKEDLDSAKDTYDLIIELMKDNNPDIEKSMLDQYENHLKSISLDLTMKIKVGTPAYIINTHVNHAKYNLFEICIKKFLEYLSNLDGRLLNVLGRINDTHNEVVKSLISIYNLLYFEFFISKKKDNIQTAETNSSKNNNGRSHENNIKSFSPLHKDRDLSKTSTFSDKKIEKKASLLPSSIFFFNL